MPGTQAGNRTQLLLVHGAFHGPWFWQGVTEPPPWWNIDGDTMTADWPVETFNHDVPAEEADRDQTKHERRHRRYHRWRRCDC